MGSLFGTGYVGKTTSLILYKETLPNPQNIILKILLN